MNFSLIILIVFFAYILSISKIRQNSLLVFGMVCVLTIVIANRSIEVPDTEGYIETFLYEADFFDFDNSPYEKGYTIFMRFFHLVFAENYVLYFSLFPLINFLLVTRASRIITKKMDNVGIESDVPAARLNIYTLLVTYFSYFGLYHNAIVLRAGLATSFVLLALAHFVKAQHKREYLSAIGCIIIAFFFHSSTLLCLPMYYLVLRSKTFEKKQYQIFLIVIFVVYLLSPFLNVIMSPLNHLFLLIANSNTSEISKYESYNSSSTIVYSGISFKFLFFYVFGWLFTTKNEKQIIWGRLLNVYILGLLIWAIFRPVLWVERLTDFYLFLYVFMAALFFSPYASKRFIPKLLIVAGLIQIAFIYRIH